MNINKCQCEKEPCVCGTGLCNNESFPKSTIIENIDENGVVNYVELIYQKIPLQDIENMECCVAQKSKLSAIDPLDNNTIDLNSIVEEEIEESSDCTDCCNQIYTIPLSDEEKHDCKMECNITAELYCQIKRQNAEPGEKFSDCSSSSSSSEDDDSDDEYIDEGSAEYITAQGRTASDNSESILEDEDFFNPNSVPHSSLIEKIENRIYCQDTKCCSLNPLQKCKYHTRNNQKITNGAKLVKNSTEKSATARQNIRGDTNEQRKQKPNENEEIEALPGYTPPNETQWTTLHPKTPRYKNKRLKQPFQIEIENLDTQEAENESQDSEEIADIILKPSDGSTSNILQYRGYSDETKWETIPGVQYGANDSTDDTEWETIVPEKEERFSGQSWKRQKLKNTIQSDNEDLPIENRRKSSKRVSLPNKLIDSVSIHTIVSNRKRKFDSIRNEFPTVHYERYSDIFNKDESKNLGRKRRITLSNFVTTDQLKEDTIVVHDTKLKPEHTDAYFLLDKSSSHVNKYPWNTYVPCERSDYSIMAVESFTKKPIKIAKIDNHSKVTNTSRRDPRNSFLRQKVVPFRPRKFLCFQYVPQLSPKTSTTSSMQDNVFEQMAIDPPDSLPETFDISETKLQNSRIPVSMYKYKTEKKRFPEFQLKKVFSTEKSDARRQTVGIDEIRNVVEQKTNVCRRLLIPPESRKSMLRKKSVSRKSLFENENLLEVFASRLLMQNEAPTSSILQNERRPSSTLQRKNQSQPKQVTYVKSNEGSDSSLRNKMNEYYDTKNKNPRLPANVKDLKDPINNWQKQENVNKEEKSRVMKTKVPLSAAAMANKPLGNNNNVLQKTCCSQTGIHVCIKESLDSENGNAESNILQMVNIEVTPKNSKLVKVNVMPTVPEVNNEGIITIPVQFQLYSEIRKAVIKNEEPARGRSVPTEELLHQENPENNEHNVEKFVREERDETSPQNTFGEPYVNLLWTKMKNTLSESGAKENDTQTSKYDNVEIQTDLTLGQKLLSKSLNSLTNNDSSSSLQNKSDPVKRSEIKWSDILLPPPGSIVIKRNPIKKFTRRYSGEPSKQKDNNMPSTSAVLPPTEEIKTRKEPSESGYLKNKLKYCCTHDKSREEPYSPANNKSPEGKATRDESPSSIEDTKTTRSNIISLVFSESFYENDNNSSPLHQTLVKEEKLLSPCTSKLEIPWTDILLPHKPQIRKIEKLDTSKTSTSITDQMLTDEYSMIPLSPKTTDTCPNLSEDSSHSHNKIFNDMGTNTSSTEEDTESVLHPLNSPATNNMTKHSLDILKSFKEDPVLSAFKAFEAELKPVRQALAEVQSKLRALNIPELECIFKKDRLSEYAISSSNSQIEEDYRQRAAPCPYSYRWASDTRRTPTSTRRPFCYDQNVSHSYRQVPTDQFEHHQRPQYDNCRVYRFTNPPRRMRSRDLTTDIWKAFGSCERNTIKGPHEKFWKSPDIHNIRHSDSCNCTPFCSAHYESNVYDNRVEMINDDEDLDYPSNYKNMPTSSHAYSQREDCYCNCNCNSEHSLYSNRAERLISNHAIRNLPPKYISSFHTPTNEYSNGPVTHFYLPEDEECGLQNPTHSCTNNISVHLKNGTVCARTKIELPKVAYKRGNNAQLNIRKIYSQHNEGNHYCQAEYDNLKYNRQHNDYNFDNSPISSCCHKEYLKN